VTAGRDELAAYAHMIGRVYTDPEGRRVRVTGLGERMVAYVHVVGETEMQRRVPRCVTVEWLIGEAFWKPKR
jgi:hypothetical protein